MIKASKDRKRVYQGKAETCGHCRYHGRCCQSKNGSVRSINGDDKEHLRQQMNQKMEGDDATALYKARKVIVEPVFGQIKNRGGRGFSVRGKEKVAGEFSLVCAVHNIKKIVKAIVRGVSRPENGKVAKNYGI